MQSLSPPLIKSKLLGWCNTYDSRLRLRLIITPLTNFPSWAYNCFGFFTTTPLVPITD